MASSKDLPVAQAANVPANSAAPVVAPQVAAVGGVAGAAVDTAKTAQPNIDINATIIDLAKKNANTKGDVSVFQIKKEKDNDFMINETPLVDLAKIFPALTSNITNENY